MKTQAPNRLTIDQMREERKKYSKWNSNRTDKSQSARSVKSNGKQNMIDSASAAKKNQIDEEKKSENNKKLKPAPAAAHSSDKQIKYLAIFINRSDS